MIERIKNEAMLAREGIAGSGNRKNKSPVLIAEERSKFKTYHAPSDTYQQDFTRGKKGAPVKFNEHSAAFRTIPRAHAQRN